MRLLFSAVPAPGHLLPLLPMAHAAVADGHDVAVATGAEMAALAAPFPVLAAGPPLAEIMAETVRRVGPWHGPGPGSAELFAGTRVDLTYDEALPSVRDFDPDLVVCEALDLVGPLLAAAVGAPWAMHGISGGVSPVMAGFVASRFAEQQAARSVEVPARTAYIDPYPDLLRDPGQPAEPDRIAVRAQAFDRVDAPYRPPVFADDRPRVLLTLGTAVNDPGAVERMAASLATSGLNVLVTAPPPPTPGHERIRYVGFVPLARLLADVALVVSAGGTGTLLATLAAGIPMVIRPFMADQPFNAAQASRAGAARTIADPDDAGSAAVTVLADPRYRAAAAAIRDEMASRPDADVVLRQLLAT